MCGPLQIQQGDKYLFGKSTTCWQQTPLCDLSVNAEEPGSKYNVYIGLHIHTNTHSSCDFVSQLSFRCLFNQEQLTCLSGHC